MYLLVTTVLLTSASLNFSLALARTPRTQLVARNADFLATDPSFSAAVIPGQRSSQRNIRKRSASKDESSGAQSGAQSGDLPRLAGHAHTGSTSVVGSSDVAEKQKVAHMLHQDSEIPTYQVHLPETRSSGRRTLMEGASRRGFEDVRMLGLQAPSTHVRDTMEQHLQHQAMSDPYRANRALGTFLKFQGSHGSGRPGEGAIGRLAQASAARKIQRQFTEPGPPIEEEMEKMLAEEKKQDEEAKTRAEAERAAQAAAQTKKREKKSRSKERKQQRKSHSATEGDRDVPGNGGQPQHRQLHSLNDLAAGMRPPGLGEKQQSMATSVEAEASRLGQLHISSPR